MPALKTLLRVESLGPAGTTICEPCAGKGNLVLPLRAAGFEVIASDISDRGCPDCAIADFFDLVQLPVGCDILLTDPPYTASNASFARAQSASASARVLLRLAFIITPYFEVRYEARTIKPAPLLADLRDRVFRQSEKRSPKWKFRLAPDLVESSRRLCSSSNVAPCNVQMVTQQSCCGKESRSRATTGGLAAAAAIVTSRCRNPSRWQRNHAAGNALISGAAGVSRQYLYPKWWENLMLGAQPRPDREM
jgi:hypothetical protein